MTARLLGLAMCPALPPVLDRPFSQGSPRNESEIQWKQNDSHSHRRLYTRARIHKDSKNPLKKLLI